MKARIDKDNGSLMLELVPESTGDAFILGALSGVGTIDGFVSSHVPAKNELMSVRFSLDSLYQALRGVTIEEKEND